MPSRYICEIHDDIDEAISKLRIDLIPGLCEEARVAGKRMEAKLHDYANLKYDIERAKELKARRDHLAAEIKRLGKLVPDAVEDDDDGEIDWDELMRD